MTDDPLNDLPRLPEEALGPCARCGKVMLASGMPIFYRLTVEHCGIDARAVQEKVGLAMMMGGGEAGLALAGIMGPGRDPVVVLDAGAVNVCMACAIESVELLAIVEKAVHAEGEAEA